MTRLFLSTLMTAVLGAATSQGAFIALSNTGVDAGGVALANGSTDTHYTVIAGPVTGSPVAYTSVVGFPIPPWLGDSAISAWISPNASNDFPAGDYTYRTTFDLTGFVPSTAAITGQYATDDSLVSIMLNGVVVPGVTTPGSFSAFTPFNITSGFVGGVNTLDFVVNNLTLASGLPAGTTNPSGLRVEMVGTADLAPTAAPAPAALPMLLLGGVVLAGVRRLRKA